MHYDLEAIKTAENLEQYCDEHLEKRGPRKYCCPICGSGNGPNHTPAFSLNGKGHWRCFSCESSGDLLDLIGRVEGIEGYADRLHRAAEIFNVSYDEEPRPTTTTQTKPVKVERRQLDYSIGRDHEARRLEQAQYDIALAESYLESRGWTVGEAQEYGLGYDKSTNRLVIPWYGCSYYHIDRATNDEQKPKYLYPHSEPDEKHPIEACVGPKPLYNPSALDEKAFVVVEGPMDAMAVMRCGVGAVVALGGTGYTDLINELKARHYQGGVAVMLDNDRAGHDASDKLLKALESAGIAASAFAWKDGDQKDADEFLQAGKYEELKDRINEALDEAEAKGDTADRSPNMTLQDPAKVAEGIYFADDADEPIPTGFKNLDVKVGGGLMRGLYIVGATSSFGKTTITVQIADAIARAGHPVLFVTIEQSAQEIVAKSLSRLTHDSHKSAVGGLSAQEITTATARKTWDTYQWERLAGATSVYTAEIAPNLRILEGVTRPSVADVRTAADAMAAQYGKAPVVMVDYLQLLAPNSDRDSDKQAVDFNVTALRIMARDLKTPVWCVATLNRESYSGPVDLDSFKESGSIEYGADYLFGLQPRGIAAEVEGVKSAVEKKLKGNGFVSKAKRENPRRVELTILKNRQGETTGTSSGLPLTYWPRTNLFVEA